MTRGRELNEAGQHRHAVEILNKLVFAEPKNQSARDLLAGAGTSLDQNRIWGTGPHRAVQQ